jgi:Ca2+-binding EF-hand superfamily protein
MTHRTLLAGGLAAIALAAAGGVALAQQAPGRVMRADADSRISRAEFVDQRVARLTAQDANGDGQVAAEERQAARQARRAAGADALFARMDADNNGSVTRAEFDAARASGHAGRRDRAGHGQGGRHGRGGPGRGEGGRAGLAAGAPVVIADARTRAEQGFARLDSDNDGFVTAAERRAGREGMREQRRERMGARHGARQASPQAPASE